LPRSKPERLGKLVAEVVELAGLSRPMLLAELDRAWREVAGEQAGAGTVVKGFRAGTLHVQVDSPARRWELESFHRPRLLEGLREKLPRLYLKELRFH
jgi:hypothetical protein